MNRVEEQRMCIKFYLENKKTGAEALQMLKTVHLSLDLAPSDFFVPPNQKEIERKKIREC